MIYWRLGVLAVPICLAAAAQAGEVRVISPSAMHSSLEALAEVHRKQSGDEVKLTFETAPALPKRLAAGEVVDIIIGFGGLTEIVRWRDKGLRLVGPLPADIQNYTVYTAALAVDAPNPDGARAFFKFLASPAAKAILASHGVD